MLLAYCGYQGGRDLAAYANARRRQAEANGSVAANGGVTNGVVAKADGISPASDTSVSDATAVVAATAAAAGAAPGRPAVGKGKGKGPVEMPLVASSRSQSARRASTRVARGSWEAVVAGEGASSAVASS